MKNSDYNLRPLWDATLLIYDVIRGICAKHGLRHFVGFGTLIGAVRHKGFIPWDDDFDIYMPRKDYDAFMKIAFSELPSNLRWQSIETDSKYQHWFGKVCESRKDFVDGISRSSRLALDGGIYIDVFPLDGLPSTSLGRWLWCVKRSLIRHGLDSSRKCFRIFFFPFMKWWSTPQYAQTWLRKRPFDTAERVGTSSPYGTSRTPRRWWHPQKWFASAVEMPFEDRVVSVPVGYHELLTAIYGDYMSLPPEDQRVPSHQTVNR